MCKIIDYINPSLVLCKISALNSDDLITNLSRHIEKQKGLSASKVKDAIMEREKYGTTGIGNGVAIPHGRIKGIKDIILVLATISSPVNYESIDGSGVSLVFMLIVPEGNNLVYLKLLSKISIMCNDKNIRSKLMNASSPDELIKIIKESE